MDLEFNWFEEDALKLGWCAASSRCKSKNRGQKGRDAGDKC
jgi:hypothetical protein